MAWSWHHPGPLCARERWGLVVLGAVLAPASLLLPACFLPAFCLRMALLAGWGVYDPLMDLSRFCCHCILASVVNDRNSYAIHGAMVPRPNQVPVGVALSVRPLLAPLLVEDCGGPWRKRRKETFDTLKTRLTTDSSFRAYHRRIPGRCGLRCFGLFPFLRSRSRVLLSAFLTSVKWIKSFGFSFPPPSPTNAVQWSKMPYSRDGHWIPKPTW
jgi:hypothetical protein